MASDRVERRLAAILAADMAGYSRLMIEDEAGTVARPKAHGRPPQRACSSSISGDMARQIQARVREVTDKPILYLVNTNYHGDHTFGNYAFPEDATGKNPGRKRPNGEPL